MSIRRSLNRSEQQIVVERRVCRSEFGAHLRPIGVDLVGNDRCEARRDPLAFVEMLDHHGDGAVRRDLNKSVGHRPVLRRRRQSSPYAEIDVGSDDDNKARFWPLPTTGALS
jgi:hypothetical protein